jgi:transcriptional regulator NrdR family protein
MACGGCSKKRNNVNQGVTSPDKYNLTGGVDIRSLNDRQIQARLEVFKRKFCKSCSQRYTCNYESYLSCLGLQQK